MISASLGFEVAGKTDSGCVRTNNEDSFAIDEKIGLLVVADGMGGHNSGEVASALATQVILECARKMILGKEPLPAKVQTDAAQSLRAKQLEYMIQEANRTIYEKGQQASKDQGMGTTIVAALIDEKKKVLTVAHVGDSRLYLFRNKQLQALTQDHSLVMDQMRHGIITAEEAQNSDFQNILTRALGSEKEVLVDTTEHPTLEGDVILLCTDGLTKMVPEPDIARILAQEGAPAAACDRLIAAALDAGGADNITAVAARISKGRPHGVRDFLNRIFHVK
jgi:protein phosphatase